MLPIADQTAGPNGLKFFCGHSWVAGGCYRLIETFFHNSFFFKLFFPQIIVDGVKELCRNFK